jgi:hypothetical protein
LELKPAWISRWHRLPARGACNHALAGGQWTSVAIFVGLQALVLESLRDVAAYRGHGLVAHATRKAASLSPWHGLPARDWVRARAVRDSSLKNHRAMGRSSSAREVAFQTPDPARSLDIVRHGLVARATRKAPRAKLCERDHVASTGQRPVVRREKIRRFWRTFGSRPSYRG